MNLAKKSTLSLAIFVAIISTVFYFYSLVVTHGWLRFSDGAKFAEIARNVYQGNGFVSDFSFYGPNIFKLMKEGHFSARGVPLAMPYSIATAFAIFGISDFSVIITSSIFYVGLVLAVLLLGRHLWGNLVGVLSAVAVAANLNLLDYATSGASETLFIFLAVLATYFLLLKKKWADISFFGSLILLYFTRPQGFVFIGVLFFVWLVQRFTFKKATLYLFGFLVGAYIFDKRVLYPLSWKTNVYPIFTRGIQAFFQYASGFAVSDALRGGTAENVTLLGLGKKVFYNLYNFYKLLPQILSPYLWTLFAIGLFLREKTKEASSFKLATILLVVGNSLLVALTIPFFRYLHPVVPFVYLLSISTLIWVVRKMARNLHLFNIEITKELLVRVVSTILVTFFVVGQTLGVIFLDSRFEADRRNKGQPPVYVQLSYLLKENTGNQDLVVTNLDTWGTWYGERRTVWFPLTPEMLKFREFEKPPFDAIYLTSYRIDDENYYMGKEWREIFDDPEGHSNKFINEHYEFAGKFEVSTEDTYEKEEARAVLLVRKSD